MVCVTHGLWGERGGARIRGLADGQGRPPSFHSWPREDSTVCTSLPILRLLQVEEDEPGLPWEKGILEKPGNKQFTPMRIKPGSGLVQGSKSSAPRHRPIHLPLTFPPHA